MHASGMVCSCRCRPRVGYNNIESIVFLLIENTGIVLNNEHDGANYGVAYAYKLRRSTNILRRSRFCHDVVRRATSS